MTLSRLMNHHYHLRLLLVPPSRPLDSSGTTRICRQWCGLRWMNRIRLRRIFNSDPDPKPFRKLKVYFKILQAHLQLNQQFKVLKQRTILPAPMFMTVFNFLMKNFCRTKGSNPDPNNSDSHGSVSVSQLVGRESRIWIIWKRILILKFTTMQITIRIRNNSQ